MEVTPYSQKYNVSVCFLNLSWTQEQNTFCTGVAKVLALSSKMTVQLKNRAVSV